MTSDPIAQWVTTGVFAALSAYCLWRLAAVRSASAAVTQVLHLGMNLVMVAMVWPWWDRLPALPQIVLFAAAAVFFAAAAGWHVVDALPGGRPVRSLRGGSHHGAGAHAVHAVMMLAMVWAVAVMSTASSAAGATRAATSGHDARHLHAATHAAHQVAPGTWAWGAGAVLGVLLVAGGVLFAVHLVRHVRGGGAAGGPDGGDHAAGAVMSGGMAVMCWLMLSGG